MVRVALVVHEVTRDASANRRRILEAIDQAASSGVELVLLPEAALTGLVNTDDAASDAHLGQAIPGPFTSSLAERARRRRLHVACGLIERDGEALYDSAVLLDAHGGMLLRYRRMQPQWHGPTADPAVYREGGSLEAIDTDLGRLLFLVCGDLFDDTIVHRARCLRPDYVLFPFARCFPEAVDAADEWRRRERCAYAARAAVTGATTMMTKYFAGPEIASGAFGGAMVVSAAGKVLAELPIGGPGVLIADVP